MCCLFSSDTNTDGADNLSEQGYCTSDILVKKQKNSKGSEAQKYLIVSRLCFIYAFQMQYNHERGGKECSFVVICIYNGRGNSATDGEVKFSGTVSFSL